MQFKTCTRCQQSKALGNFPTYPNGKPKSWCSDCQTSYVREKRRNTPKVYKRRGPVPIGTTPTTPLQRRAHRLKNKFGISVQQYDAMYAAQGGVCAICGSAETKVIRGQVQRLAVDHDHTTGKVRGLLCHVCNVALGMLRDSPKLLQKALEYVQHHSPPS